MEKQDEKAYFSAEKHVNTESNLKSHVFDNIAKMLGIDVSNFESKYNFIDESLLRGRNCIAHGEYLDIRNEDWKELSDTTLQLMRMFKNDVTNSILTDAYKK